MVAVPVVALVVVVVCRSTAGSKLEHFGEFDSTSQTLRSLQAKGKVEVRSPPS